MNYEGLRLAQADAQTLTVPTPEEVQGDFSMNNAPIYDPTTAVTNPAYDPSQPAKPSNFPTRAASFRQQDPADRINPQLEMFLMQHVPMPNMAMDMATGVDSNNYLDSAMKIIIRTKARCEWTMCSKIMTPYLDDIP